ncbi:hypothetical protein RFI_32267, partial [Reticulomyxa filosa]
INDISRCQHAREFGIAAVDQSQDWLFHRTVCNPVENMLQLHEMKNKKCNVLSIDQEEKEGINYITDLDYTRCLDLKSYLIFSEMTGNWQCTVCAKPLKYEELCDYKMLQIINNENDENDLIQLYYDYKYKIVTNQEQNDEDINQNYIRKKKENFHKFIQLTLLLLLLLLLFMLHNSNLLLLNLVLLIFLIFLILLVLLILLIILILIFLILSVVMSNSRTYNLLHPIIPQQLLVLNLINAIYFSYTYFETIL